MSWSRLVEGRNFGFPAVVVIAGLLTAACGFTPVYRQDEPNSVRQNMAQIEVAPIGGQHGLQLRNRLLEKFTPRGGVDLPQFRLSVNLESSTQELLIQLDNSATRQNLRMKASFSLTDLTSGEILFKDKSVSVGGFNVVDSEFATIVAENNAAERAARKIGEDIFDLLVVYFNRTKS